MRGMRRCGRAANLIAGSAAIAMLLLVLPAAAAAEEPWTPPNPEPIVSRPTFDDGRLAIPTAIRVESPREGLELRLWAVTPPGPYEQPFWSDNGRRLCWTPCTLALPEGTYHLGIDHDYEFDVVAQGDPLLLRVAPTNQTLRAAGVWMLIAGSIQVGVALLSDLLFTLMDGMFEDIGSHGGDSGPSMGDRFVGQGSLVGGILFGISMLGGAVALTGAGLMIGAGGSVDELPGDLQPESTGDVFIHRPGTRFFPPTTVPE